MTEDVKLPTVRVVSDLLERFYTTLQVSPKKTLGALAILLVIAALPLTVLVAQKQQTLEQHAAGLLPAQPTSPHVTSTSCTGTNNTVSTMTFAWTAGTGGGTVVQYDVNYNGVDHLTGNTSTTYIASTGITGGNLVQWYVIAEGSGGNSPRSTQGSVTAATCTGTITYGCVSGVCRQVAGGTYSTATCNNTCVPPPTATPKPTATGTPGSGAPAAPTSLNGDSYFGYPKNSPATNTQGTVFTTFTWSAVSGATSYILNYNDQAGKNYGPYTLTGNYFSTTFTGPQPVGPAHYSSGSYLQCQATGQMNSGFACGFACDQKNLTMTVQAVNANGKSTVSSASFNTALCSLGASPSPSTSPSTSPSASPGTLACTLSANPSSVAPNGQSTLTTTCSSGTPTTYTWPKPDCGATVDVNSASTTWTGPNSGGQTCNPSVKVCDASNNCVNATAPITVTSPNDTTIQLVLGLDGIGSTGDTQNANPIANSNPIFRSNPNPIHKTRTIEVDATNSSGSIIASGSGSVTYDPTSGKFAGPVPISGLAAGTYNILVKSPGYLRRKLATSTPTTPGGSYNVSGNLIAGDINGDNHIDLLDFNILISCAVFSTNTATCNLNTNYPVWSDLTDNTGINADEDDYNLLLREWHNFTQGD